MQKVPFRVFQSFPGLQSTMQAMVSQKYSDFKQSYHVKRLCDELQKRYSDFSHLHSEVLKDADYDDNKKLLNKEEIDKKLGDLLDTKIDMKWVPLDVSVVEQLNPTPEQFSIIEHLMDPKDLGEPHA